MCHSRWEADDFCVLSYFGWCSGGQSIFSLIVSMKVKSINKPDGALILGRFGLMDKTRSSAKIVEMLNVVFPK